MIRDSSIVALVAGALGWACASVAPPIPIVADPVDLSALVGEWSGEYESRDTGRSGSILFTLAAGTDTAYGDVVMIPLGYNEPLSPVERDQMSVPMRPTPEVLTIRFVRIERGNLSGVLDPYRDPACGCTVETTFTGRLLSGGTIEGTFVTRGAAPHAASSGRWRVTRVRS